MKLDRYFYSISAVVFLLITFWGFHSFYLYGKAAGGNPIAPEMFVLDSIHGAAMSAWVLLFLVQAVLIGVRNRRLHMKLGWAALAIAPVLTVCGILTALRSVQSSLASYLVRSKTDLKTVQALLRHADVKTTLQLYTHSMSEDRMLAQGSVLEAILGGGTGESGLSAD